MKEKTADIDILEEKEKKAYDNLIMLKYFTMEKEDKESIDIILKLVEALIAENKELKEEIEELKAISEYRENIIKGLGLKTIPKTITEFKQLIENNDKKWEDKIKTKIEEVKDGTFDAKIVLQSLLGKE